MVSYVGRRPISTVPTPMLTSVRTNIDLRPIRSPKWLRMTAPNGRTKNPTPIVPIASSLPTSGSRVGKKSLFKTSDAAVE
jgi:hypothetical protein